MNKVIIQGRITKELELKYSQSNMAILGFTLAVNRKYIKEGEERQADFIMCKAFGKTAENINNYFGKGKLILIEGRIQTGSYEKEDGTKVYTTDVIVDGFDFTGEKKDSTIHEQSGVGFTPIDNGEDDLPF